MVGVRTGLGPGGAYGMLCAMGEVSIDPDRVDRVADRLDEKATETIALRKRASVLGVAGVASGLSSVIAWAEGTAAALRVAADIGRGGAAGNGLQALSLYGLVAPGTVSAQRQAGLLGALQQTMLDAESSGPVARARAVRDYFAGLTPQERSWLAVNAPDAVGGLDGAPSVMRFAANRVLIERALANETAKLAATPDDANDPDLAKLRNRVRQLEGFLAVTPSGKGDMATGARVPRLSGRQFLLFDDFGDGKAAEVLGDLDGAQDVAVTVPGITNRLDNFNLLIKDGTALMRAASSRRKAGNAVVVWLGYDTPELGDSAVTGAAEVAGPQLAAFRAGLDIPPTARTTMLAHSYGTLVASKALQDGAVFDNVVFMGSPGLGSDVKSVKGLGVPPTTQVFDMRAPGDFVAYTHAHGNDPADFPDITRLATNASGAPKVSKHSSYYEAPNDPPTFDTASESLRNLTRVMIGDRAVTTTHTTEAQESPVGPSFLNQSWADDERRAVWPLLKARNHLGWADSAKDSGIEAIADTKDAVTAVNDWKMQRELDEGRVAIDAGSATVRGVEDAAGWTGDRIADSADLAGDAASNTVDGVEDTAAWAGNRAKDAWHGANPFD